MSCKAGYPESPCPFNDAMSGRVTRATCGPCKNFVPPRHILKWCMLWDRDKVLCKLPKSACEKCVEKAPDRGAGRPIGDGKLDMNSPADRAKYDAEYRKNNADKIAEKRERFFDKHPHYMRDYMKDYRRKLRERLEKEASEPGPEKVR